MQNYTMASIPGLKVDLSMDMLKRKGQARVAGYEHVVAEVPYDTIDAVLTKGGILAMRDRNNRITSVVIQNHEEIFAAVDVHENAKSLRSRNLLPASRIDAAVIGSISTGKIASGPVHATHIAAPEKITIHGIPGHGTLNSDTVTAGRLRVGQGINITDNDLMDNSTQPQNAENQIRSMIREELEQRVAAVIDAVAAQTKALTSKIAVMEEEIKRLGGRTVARTPAEDLDRTCAEYGGLPGGSMASYSDNPFIRSKK